MPLAAILHSVAALSRKLATSVAES
uniref:Uncharacterized protein n=1 Tax=Arundo donax TaxID=35708 RepID=A0A0A9E0S4_ARUDO